MAQGSKTATGNGVNGILYEVNLIPLSQLASEFCNNYDNWNKIKLQKPHVRDHVSAVQYIRTMGYR